MPHAIDILYVEDPFNTGNHYRNLAEELSRPPVAFCLSRGCDRSDGHLGEVKRVNQTKVFCPDCGHALIWRTAKQSDSATYATVRGRRNGGTRKKQEPNERQAQDSTEGDLV